MIAILNQHWFMDLMIFNYICILRVWSILQKSFAAGSSFQPAWIAICWWFLLKLISCLFPNLLCPEKKVLWYQLWDRKKLCRHFALMNTEAFSRNVGKVFWSQSWYQRTLFSICAGANWGATTSVKPFKLPSNFHSQQALWMPYHYMPQSLTTSGDSLLENPPAWHSFLTWRWSFLNLCKAFGFFPHEPLLSNLC